MVFMVIYDVSLVQICMLNRSIFPLIFMMS